MYVVGFDIGGTKCAVLIAKIAQGKVDFLSRSQICTEGSWQSILDRLCEIYERQLALLELSKQDITAAGVSCGGPLRQRKGAYPVAAQSARLGQRARLRLSG